jgi:hypothetical protein
MTKSILALLIATSLATPACLINTDNGDIPPPFCVTIFHPGDQFTVSLEGQYDATSPYSWDASVVPSVDQSAGSCAAVDELQVGSTVTFGLARQASAGDTCYPWRATFGPEPLNEGVPDEPVPSIDGVTIAAASARGVIGGRQATATRVLFTPSGNPYGTLSAGQVPPIVVTRELTWSGGAAPARCFDAWVGTWEQ